MEKLLKKIYDKVAKEQGIEKNKSNSNAFGNSNCRYYESKEYIFTNNIQ